MRIKHEIALGIALGLMAAFGSTLAKAGGDPVKGGGDMAHINIAAAAQSGTTIQAQTQAPNDEDGGISPEFEGVKLGLLPVTPEEVRAFMAEMEEVKRASNEPVRSAKPRSRTVIAPLSTSEAPVTVELLAGHDTMLVFTDSSGQPWPVIDKSAGNDAAYVAEVSEKMPHILKVNVKANYVASNMGVILEGLPIPILFKLINGTDTVDYTLNVTVPRPGPNAIAVAGQIPVPGIHDTVLARFIDGDRPEGAEELRVRVDGDANIDTERSSEGNNGVRAWRYNGRMIVLTRHVLTSPEILEIRPAPDGNRGYVTLMAPVILLADGNGQMHMARIDVE